MKPTARPRRPHFSSGPCAKRPGWSASALAGAATGRSHRAAAGRAKLVEVLDHSRALLGLPADWRIGIVPGSDTGAVEMALWSLLGARGVDVLAWEAFGKAWVADIVQQLRLADVRVLEADYGSLPDLRQVEGARDIVFAWNGTTSGVCVPHGDWIPAQREGLVICDATSAVFAIDLPWARLDAVTWSWQKALGGEGAHGMLAVGPRAVARLEAYRPAWPLPKLFQLAKGGTLIEGIFRGDTINTPSMLCAEDAIDSLIWAEAIGGLPALVARTRANAAAIAGWVARTPWIDHLATSPEIRSPTSVCLRIVDPWFRGLDRAGQAETAQRLVDRLEAEGAAFDIGSYRDAPPGLRIWAGATVETSDIEALLPWLDWAWSETRATLGAAA